MKKYVIQTLALIAMFIMTGMAAIGAEDQANPTEKASSQEVKRQAMVKKGIEYLRMNQGETGAFSPSPRSGIGPTTVVLIGLLQSGVPVTDPMVKKSLDYLEKAIKPDGGIYSPGGRIATYESCLALQAFHLAKKAAGNNQYDKIVQDAEKFIRAQQYSEENGTSKDDVIYGGLGYGGKTRPDLSNTQFFVETLHDMGYGPDDEGIQRALVFVSRCQNLESGANTTTLAAKNPDGGFFYTCAGEGESPAGEVNGGLRSYGSMTYAGLKSMIYAGLDANDPRIKAASGWIRDNYSLTENPGLGRRGLFYYYHTMAKTLDALGNPFFTDKNGTRHDWKNELIDTLAAAQNEDGSWVNDNRMWMETDPNLVTGYVLIVLSIL